MSNQSDELFDGFDNKSVASTKNSNPCVTIPPPWKTEPGPKNDDAFANIVIYNFIYANVPICPSVCTILPVAPNMNISPTIST